MNARSYLKILSDEIHSVVVATVDRQGLPTTRVIDIMLADDQGLYFLTARGKAFYQQLIDKKYLSLSGMTGGANSMSKKSITLSGPVQNIGTQKLDEIFEKNPYMAEIYPTQESRTALEVFSIYQGQGNYFDLSTRPITRGKFSFGETEHRDLGYSITDICNGCGACLKVCPQQCISEGSPYQIHQEHCLHCGNCYQVCPMEAVICPC